MELEPVKPAMDVSWQESPNYHLFIKIMSADAQVVRDPGCPKAGVAESCKPLT